MGRFMRAGWMAASLMLSAGGVVATAPPAMAAQCDVGDPWIITTSTRLSADLYCPGGIRLQADGITFDLSGHTVSGDDGGVGIWVQNHDGVTIKNGTVESFSNGVMLSSGADRNKVRSLNLRLNKQGSGDVGILVIDGANDNLIESNVLDQNATGVRVLDSDGTKVRGNSVTYSYVKGIAVAGTSASTTLSRNTVIGTACGGLPSGIFVENQTTATVITGNVANQNCGDGIEVETASASVGLNTANNNLDLGIQGVAGITDAGRNRARGNGDARQCTFVVCS